MKRTILFLTAALCITALCSAQQGYNRRGSGGGQHHQGRQSQGAPANAEKVTVSGNLTIANGMIALKSGDITYLTRGLGRYVGFIDGIKDGAAVSVEGLSFSPPDKSDVKFLRIEKLTIGGKDYDLARTPGQWQEMRQGGRNYGGGGGRNYGGGCPYYNNSRPHHGKSGQHGQHHKRGR